MAGGICDCESRHRGSGTGERMNRICTFGLKIYTTIFNPSAKSLLPTATSSMASLRYLDPTDTGYTKHYCRYK
jgi:hypothetical protein